MVKIHHTFLFFFCIFLLVLTIPAKAIMLPDENPISFSDTIPDQEGWQQLSSQPNSHIAAHAQVVKFVIDRFDSWKIYYINSNKWPIHYDFVYANIDRYPHELFNLREYRGKNRRFVMGSIVYYRDQKQWALETIPGDTMSSDLLLKAYQTIQESSFFGGKIKFRPQSELHEQRAQELKNKMPIWDLQEFQSGIQFQPMTLGTSYGYLRIVKGTLDPTTVQPRDILVTEHVPDDLPVCAGLITSKMQAPLAHIALLLENRQTPNMVSIGAFKDQNFLSLEGRAVKLDVLAQDFKITQTTDSAVYQYGNRRKPKTALAAKRDLTDIGLPDLCDVNLKKIGAVGGKAAYLGEMCQIKDKVHLPDGFVIPTYHYDQHLKNNKLTTSINQFLSEFSASPQKIKLAETLKKIRQQIKTAPVNVSLIAEIKNHLRRFPQKKIIFRSSANAEDLKGFSGAGLYDSTTLSATSSDKKIATALRTVWASLWNLRAFQERDWYKMDHKSVAMAVIIQPYIDSLYANGVAITANPFYEARPGYLINVQTMSGSITGAKNGESPESLLVYNYSDTLETHVLSRSRLNQGRPILSSEQIQNLMDALRAIHSHFITQSIYQTGEAMDVEFLINQKGRVIIVQARPYRVTFREKFPKLIRSK